MQTIVGVRFKKVGRTYYFSPGRLTVAKGDHVIVETARGLEYGEVVLPPREMPDADIHQPLNAVQRKATPNDDARVEYNQRFQDRALKICAEKIAQHGLDMKLMEAECTFDMSKIIFYFMAEGRVDFRGLVKDLASTFRMRIELRQIGIRDKARLLGGIGCCGRPLCCATFLGGFNQVTIHMAKEQNLSLNPSKISGTCGRLMCCLKYENDYYAELCPPKKTVQAPTPGERIASAEGEGKVISVNTQRRTATILLDDGKTMVASWEDVVSEDDDGASRGKQPPLAAASIKDKREPTAPPREKRERRPAPLRRTSGLGDNPPTYQRKRGREVGEAVSDAKMPTAIRDHSRDYRRRRSRRDLREADFAKENRGRKPEKNS
ncbi:MAG: stage 0 sporulation family protein [Selenomonadaceae bacterium]|nr:stage 0 sporulation family protein [Selenomonadaceae bacterium]